MTLAALGAGLLAHATALLMLLLQALLGARILSLARMDRGLTELERLLFGQAAGFVFLTAASMLLVGLDALGPAMVVALAVGSLAVAAPEVRRTGAGLASAARHPSAAWLMLAALALACWAWPFWLQTLLPNTDWDSALYHLPLAERQLDGALWGRDPYFPAFAFPAAVHLSYAALIAIDLERAITPLCFWTHVLTLVAAASLAARLAGQSAAAWTTAVLATTPILWQLGVDPRIDGFLAWHVTLAGYALVLCVQQRDPQRLPLLALSLGAALGVKYSALLFAGILVAIALGDFLLRKAQGDLRLSAKLIGVCAALMLFPNASWYVANAMIHGDPLFPMLRGNYYERVAEAGTPARVYFPAASEELEPELLADPEIRDRIAAMPAVPTSSPPTHLWNPLDILTQPDRYAVKPNHGLSPLLFISLLLPLLVGRLRLEPAARRAALALWLGCWASYALLGSQTNLLRYVLPVFPGIAVTAGVLLSRISMRSVQALVAVGVALLLVRTFQIEERKLALLEVDTAIGGEAPADVFEPAARNRWLKRVGYNFTPPMAYATETINDFVASGRMQPDDRVLMVGEGKGRLLRVDSLPDASWFGHRFVGALLAADLDHATLARRLRRDGITHVLWNRAYFEQWVLDETAMSRSQLAFALVHLERFLATYGRIAFSGGGIELFELRPALGAPGAQDR